MTKDDVKKSLYKENPMAKFSGVDKHGIHYTTILTNGSCVVFTIPLDPVELGETRFGDDKSAKHLNRYIASWD
jgi:hypothetical protein